MIIIIYQTEMTILEFIVLIQLPYRLLEIIVIVATRLLFILPSHLVSSISTVLLRRQLCTGASSKISSISTQRCIYLLLWEVRFPQFFFCHAEIFKSGYFMQIYSNQSVLCRNIGQVPLRVTQSCAADYLDRTWMQCLFFFRFH